MIPLLIQQINAYCGEEGIENVALPKIINALYANTTCVVGKNGVEINNGI